MKRWAWLAGLAGGLTLAGAALAETQSLTILHDNDIHGHLRSFCYVEVAKGPDEHCEIGGAARRATLVKRLRGEATGPVLLVDTGDTSTRGPLINAYEGLDETKALYEWKYGKQLLYTQILKEKIHELIEDADTLEGSLKKLGDFQDVFFSRDFLEPRPILKAMEQKTGSVLLVDGGASLFQFAE